MNKALHFNFILTILTITVLIDINAQFQNYRVSSQSSTSPEEVTIAINPVNPNYLLAGANIRFVYRSTDGGYTWSQDNMSSSHGVWGDPVIVYDVNGHAYYGHLSNPPSPGYWIDRIVVQKTTDNGLTWSDGVGVGFNPPNRNQDKEWLAVDFTNSPFRNNIYMSWTEFDSYGSSNPNDSSRILFSRSTNSGLTWMTPVKISDKSGDCIDEDNTVEGAVPAVGPNGEVYVAWAGPLGIMFDRSFDGGITWGNDIFVSNMPGGWDLTIPGIYRCNGLPITACDISNSPYRGNIYVNWTDQRNGINNTDVFLARSTDGGSTWSQPIKVNQDNSNRHQFFTWMTIDQSNGNLYFVYYDRRDYSDNKTDVYIARSSDGGNTFTEYKVSTSSFSPVMSVFFGDYITIAAHNGRIHPIWTRMDGTALSVWTAVIFDSDLIVPVELISFAGESVGNKIELNWATASEANNRGFVIERKIDDLWSEIGFVRGHGTTTQTTNYSFIDDKISLNHKSIIKYRLKQMDFDGKETYSEEIEIMFDPVPDKFVLFQNYPNPFNPSSTISFDLIYDEYVTLRVYDILGREIAVLLNNEWKVKGRYNYKLEIDKYKLSGGVYFYQLQAESFIETKKMIYLK